MQKHGRDEVFSHDSAPLMRDRMGAVIGKWGWEVRLDEDDLLGFPLDFGIWMLAWARCCLYHRILTSPFRVTPGA